MSKGSDELEQLRRGLAELRSDLGMLRAYAVAITCLLEQKGIATVDELGEEVRGVTAEFKRQEGAHHLAPRGRQ